MVSYQAYILSGTSSAEDIFQQVCPLENIDKEERLQLPA
jgi:hypothetical protein